MVDPELGEAGDIDSAAVTLKTASGKIVVINNSRRATYGYDQRVEVHGSDGMLRAANQLEHLVEQAGGAGFTTAPNKHFFLERYEGAYIAEMEAFIAALNSGATPTPNISDGVAAQRLADAAAESLRTGLPINLA